MHELGSIVRDIDTAFAEFTPETQLSIIRARLDQLFEYDNPDSGCSRERVRLCHADAELITPKNAPRQNGAILYIHGGGFAVCSITSHRDLAERLACATNAMVLLLDYRLAPENPFPAALDDCVGAYQWLLSQGHEASSVAIAGDSAGGNLVLATLLAIKQRLLPRPACAAMLSPWVDLELKGDTMSSKAEVDPIVKAHMLEIWVQCYAPNMDINNPLISPLHGDLRGLPPLFVQAGGREVLLDDSLRLVKAARAAGVEVEYQFWEHQIHVFQVFGHRLADARKAINDIGAFLRRNLGQPKTTAG
jgi:epsilon-lactone hydrolase